MGKNKNLWVRLLVLCVLIGLIISLVRFWGAAQAEDPYEVEWIRQFGTAGNDSASSVSTDTLGNVYVAGYLSTQAFSKKFDQNGTELWSDEYRYVVTRPNAIFAHSSGIYVVGDESAKGFIGKYDADGNYAWGFNTFSLGGYTEAEDVAADDSGFYVVGRVRKGNYWKAFIRKCDHANGSPLWTNIFTSGGHSWATGIAVHSSGIYVIGDQGSQSFINKYDSNGNQVWAQPTLFNKYAYDVSADDTGIYVVGPQGGDVAVRQFDVDGNEVWSKRFGTSAPDNAWGVSASDDCFYVGGLTRGAFPGNTNAGDYDGFMVKFDSNKNFLWAKQFGSAAADYCLGVSAGPSGVYGIGATLGALPGQQSLGGSDAFIIKLGGCNLETMYPRLASIISDMEISQGIKTSLSQKVNSSQDAFTRGKTKVAINVLKAFINECEAQRGKKLTELQANQLIKAATDIVGCMQEE